MRWIANAEFMHHVPNTMAGENCQLYAPLWATSKAIGRSDMQCRNTCVAYNDKEIILERLRFWDLDKIENFIRIPFTDLKRVETYHNKSLGIPVLEIHLILVQGAGYHLNLPRNLKTFPEQNKNIDSFLKMLTPWMYN